MENKENIFKEYDKTTPIEENYSVPFAMLPSDDEDGFLIDSSEEALNVQYKGLPTCEAVLNLLTSIVGSGLLALPYVVSKGGLIAIIALMVVPVICYYTGAILIDCLYERSHNGYKVRVRSTYRDISDACWPGKIGIVTVVLQATQLALSASLCIVLSASLLSHILSNLDKSDRGWVVIATMLVFPMVLLRDLSQVSWINILSITALFSPVVVITGYGFFMSKPWDLRDLPLWRLEGIPLSISIITHSYVPHGALPVIEDSMEEKPKYNFMLKVTYIVCAVLRTMFAVNGFFSYYGNINDVISNSLPPGVLITINTLLLIYSILSYAFAGIALIHIIETSFLSESTLLVSGRRWFVISRILLTAISFLIAILVPRYAVLIAISGNLKSVLGFILPCLFHLKLRASEMNTCNIVVDFFIIALGIAIVIIGTTASIFQIINIY